MTAAWLWARSRLRHRWRTFLVIALVAGVGAGISMVAAAGSRRAATGWDRFRGSTLAPDAIVNPPPDRAFEDLEAVPGVQAAGHFTYTPVAPAPLVPGRDGGAFVAFQPSVFTTVYRPRILEGRRPRPGAADEVTMNQALADSGRLRVGAKVHLRSGFDPSELVDLGEATIVGIHVGSFDVGANRGNPSLLLNSAFYEAHSGALVLGSQPAALVRLVDGSAGVGAVQSALRRIYGPGVVALSAEQDAQIVKDSTNVQAGGLGLLALAALLATMVAAVQAIGRVLRSEQDDLRILRSIGLRRRDVVAGGALIGLSVGLPAVGIATAIGVLGSERVPTGTAALLEVDGLRVDLVVVVLVGALLVTLITVAAALLGLRAVSRRDDAARTRAAPTGGPVPVRLGTHWAFSRGGASAATIPARAALVAVAVGVAGVAGVVTFARSLGHLAHTDSLYGWTFDAALGSFDADEKPLPRTAAALVEDERVEGLAWAWVFDAPIGNGAVEVVALDAIRGDLHPSLVRGRAPVAADEVALGVETMEQFDVAIGDSVRIGRFPFRIVGKAVYPELGNNSDLANFASITVAGMDRLGAEPVQSLALVDLRHGVDAEDVLGRYTDDAEIVPSFQPPRVHNIAEIGALPWLMAGFLVALVLIAVGHALASSVRARRRELGVLRAFGALRSQLAAAVWCQATATVAVGALVGVPLGVAAGRQGWSFIAGGLGVVDRPVMAWATLAAVVVGVLVVANVVAMGPAIAAARQRPAAALRSE